jgi:5-methyltetrahydropteroyltriglutamate--homocysteine methyltransferase
MKFKLEPLDTTVAGSFPVLPFYPVKQDFPPYTDEVPEGEPYVDDPFIPGIFRALRLQERARIDYPSYGQPQEMCSMFLGYLVGHGLEYENGFQVVGDLEIPEKIPAIEYLQVARKYFSFKGVKMPLTGPMTLAASVKVGQKTAIEYSEIVETLAEFVSQIAYSYDRGGAALICIDEPSLVYGLYVGLDPEFCIEMINTSLKRIHNAVPAIHVCGKLNTQIQDILLSTDAVVLDHEFAAIPENLDVYPGNVLESSGKFLGYGCVVSNMEPALLLEIQKDGNWQKVVESEKVIKKRIAKALDLWGRENIVLDPDCGFGGMKGYIQGELTEDVALKICSEKLKRMVHVREGIA